MQGREEKLDVSRSSSLATSNFILPQEGLMYRLDRFLMPLGLVALVIPMTGCGGTPTLETEYVEGVVTVDGNPSQTPP
jgi:hypothetical protein